MNRPAYPIASPAGPQERKGVPDAFFFVVMAESLPSPVSREFKLLVETSTAYPTFDEAAKVASADAENLPKGAVYFIVQAMGMVTRPRADRGGER